MEEGGREGEGAGAAQRSQLPGAAEGRGGRGALRGGQGREREVGVGEEEENGGGEGGCVREAGSGLSRDARVPKEAPLISSWGER